MDTAAVDPIDLLFSYGDEKVEWVGGMVVGHPYESFDENRLKGFLSTILGFFAEQRSPGRVLGSKFLQRLNASTVRAPDVSYLKQSGFDRIRPTHLQGGADLVIEITVPESRRRDRGEKFYEYEAAGIGEYWLVDVERRRAEFHRLPAGLYDPVVPDEEGKIYSSVLPGFFVRVDWLWTQPNLFDAFRELGIP